MANDLHDLLHEPPPAYRSVARLAITSRVVLGATRPAEMRAILEHARQRRVLASQGHHLERVDLGVPPEDEAAMIEAALPLWQLAHPAHPAALAPLVAGGQGRADVWEQGLPGWAGWLAVAVAAVVAAGALGLVASLGGCQ